MAFEDIKAEIRLLMRQMERQMDRRPEDQHELYLKLHEKLNELRALGMGVPDDLAILEKELEAKFSAEGGDQT
jgi:hypothetical protein